MDHLILISAIVACLIVAVILALGLAQMGKGGIEGAKKSNKLMQARIIAQAVAVVIALAYVFFIAKSGS